MRKLLFRARRAREKLRELSRVERLTYVQAWWELLAAALKHRFWSRLSTPALEELGARGGPMGPAPETRHLSLFEQATFTQPMGVPCLPRALALKRFLRRHGTGARLRLGMKKTPEGWTGHAWLEHEGRVIGDREDFVRTFVPFRETA